MKIDIEELKRLAEAATPGPWVAAFNTNMDKKVCHSFGDICQTGKDIGDAIFIAAANPAAILALIEQHDAAHFELLETRDDNHSMMLEIHNLRIERDELLAVLKSIDDAVKTSQSIIGFAGKLMGMLKQARAAIANAEKQS